MKRIKVFARKLSLGLLSVLMFILFPVTVYADDNCDEYILCLPVGFPIHLSIEKQTIDNEPGDFSFRVKIWQEHYEEIGKILYYSHNRRFESINSDDYFDTTAFQGYEGWDYLLEFEAEGKQYASQSFFNIQFDGEAESGLYMETTEEDADIKAYYMMGKYRYYKKIADYMDEKPFSEIIYDGKEVKSLDDENITINYHLVYDEQYYYQYVVLKKTVEYIDLSSQLGEPLEEGTYGLTLKNGESKLISSEVPHYDWIHYEISEVYQDGWTLESINGIKGIDKYGEYTSDSKRVVFLNRKLPEDKKDTESLVNGGMDIEPSLAVPNTGKNTGSTSAISTGIIAFSIIATFGRVIYLIQKNKR